MLTLFQDGCRELQCTAGKRLVNGSRCSTIVRRVRGLGYHLHLLLRPVNISHEVFVRAPTTTTTTTTTITSTTPSTSTINSSSDVYSSAVTVSTLKVGGDSCDYAYANILRKRMHAKIGHYNLGDFSANITTAATAGGRCFTDAYRSPLEELMRQEKVRRRQRSEQDLEILTLNIDQHSANQTSFLTAQIEANIVASMSRDRDAFEEDVISALLHQDWIVYFGKWTVNLRPVDLSTGLHGNGKELTNAALYGVDAVETKSVPYIRQGGPLSGLEHLFLPLSDRLLCPQLTFRKDELQLKVSGAVMLVSFPFYLGPHLEPVSFEASIYPNGAWLTADGQLMMCSSTFQEVFPQNVTAVKPYEGGASLVRQIMSIVCGGVSVVCLAVTFLTYALFRQLRSLPGLNNMGLSGSLAAAQLTLLIPWHRTHSVSVCRAVGVVTHWLWLTALGWMGVCCVHMARVFASKTRLTLTERVVKKAFLRRLLFILLLSTTVVALTIIATTAASGGSSIGYGGAICFLDTGYHQLIILAFMLPLALLVAANLVCFGVTVVSIVRVRRLQQQLPGERRHDVLVYAKLVTVTGGAWLLALLAEVTDQEWMRVLAELCTAAQGLLLFLAYVCNARVWSLYLARFGSSRPAPTSASGTAITKSTRADGC